MNKETQIAIPDLPEDLSLEKLLIEELCHGVTTLNPGGQSTTTELADPSIHRPAASPEPWTTLA